MDRTIDLTLTLEQAAAIYRVTDFVGGHPVKSPRHHINQVRGMLEDEDIHTMVNRGRGRDGVTFPPQLGLLFDDDYEILKEEYRPQPKPELKRFESEEDFLLHVMNGKPLFYANGEKVENDVDTSTARWACREIALPVHVSVNGAPGAVRTYTREGRYLGFADWPYDLDLCYQPTPKKETEK